ncbi:carboxyltransferase domain-containing protein [Candidatus Ruthia endofausta]|uniref:Carboxyltransferase domain-containing protein n=1 Tax=Candidatus Ruthia endofausta TaxID=2738852 RepID=A0A6N0HNT6_9GAMM|nr:allophanate hydrolase subunit 1 [Candidatus Ruthia endofausta]QKQ24032.1 carboxyltransferase domain-containing protein [Candidatus Ruthia endofausta]
MHKIILAGEHSLLIYFGHKIDPNLPKNIASFSEQLIAKFPNLIIDLTPSYTSLLVSYNLNLTTYQSFAKQVEQCLNAFEYKSNHVASTLLSIPVYYGFETGLDLERLLTEKQLDLNAFIDIHSSVEYLVYAIGFSPVFAFLGEVDSRIRAPRLATPRIKIPAGYVGVAQSQTAIYPTDSSGGWNIIGRTPIDLSLNNPSNIDKFKTGDRVKFYPINKNEYIKHGGKL